MRKGGSGDERKGGSLSPAPITHCLSLRLFLRWGLDWPRCGDDTSFFRSLVGEGGPVPLPILMGRSRHSFQGCLPGCRRACPGLAGSVGATCPEAALGGPRKLKPPLCLVSPNLFSGH